MSEAPVAGPGKVLAIACGALAGEIRRLVKLNGWDHVDLECLPARLHNEPGKITPAVERLLEKKARRYERVLIGYADCGTGGRLDALLEKWPQARRLPGAHCYEFYATAPLFAELHQAEPGTFYLTDFLAAHFDRLVWEFLGLDRHPQLRDDYFGNYRRLVYLSQTEDRRLLDSARRAADRLGLEFRHIPTGMGDLASSLHDVAQLARAG